MTSNKIENLIFRYKQSNKMSVAIETMNMNQNKLPMDLFDDLEGNLNDSFRRMSIDSGVSMSPTSASTTSMSTSGDASLQQRRKKKKRIRSTR